ncbi:MAG: phosphate signaling complex protein PhoU [Desulfomonile tiedjei]|nr:phosphate signaling complex protein PhoU [Desulfomonile tiedjei]
MRTNVRLRLRRKIEKLNSRLVSVGAQVEEGVQLAVRAIEARDADLAAGVIDGDVEIDREEVDLEEECLEILALHQPVAVDLRHIIAVLKINKDLERAGDLAVNIAETAVHLSSAARIEVPKDYFVMARKTQSMLRTSLDAFVNMSVESAYEVLAEDDEVDRMKHTLHKEFEDRVKEESGSIQPLTHLFLVSRHLERIADLATNIAEEVIYMVTGEIVRHGKKTLAESTGWGMATQCGGPESPSDT